MEVINPMGANQRKCGACDYTGSMKTWLSNYTTPQLIFLLLFFSTFTVGGIIFLVVYWGKFKCPMCGAVGKNKCIDDDDRIPCPYCAEMIKRKAIVCRFCNRDLATS